MSNTSTTDDSTEPKTDNADERSAIRSELEETDMNILVFFGGEPAVTLANRETPTEYPMDDEILVQIEWASGEDYALSVCQATSGTGVQWDLIDELVEIVDTRAEAIETAAQLFEEYTEEGN